MPRRTPRVEFRRNEDGQWYWRFLSGNGTELAKSSKSYRRKIDAKDCAEVVLGEHPDSVHLTNEPPFVVKEIGNYTGPKISTTQVGATS